MQDQNELYVSNREDWCCWLETNGEKLSEIWLIFYKSHTGKSNLPYEDAIEEALCFGWIDSIVKRIDNEKYVRKFTPRKEKSKWSALNVRRVNKMIKAGKMTPKGLALYKYAEEHGLLPDITQSSKKKLEIPSFINKSLSTNHKAETAFNNLAPSYQRQYIGWIMDAKKEETRIRRLKEMIQVLKKGEKLGMK